MKYWNKQPRVRATWTKVVLNTTQQRKIELKRWCQNNGSPNKFYCAISIDTWPFFAESVNHIWWFENTEDATIFVLKWT